MREKERQKDNVKDCISKEKNVKGCVEKHVRGHAALKIKIRTYLTSKCSRKSVETIAGTIKNVSNAVVQIRKEEAVSYMSVCPQITISNEPQPSVTDDTNNSCY